MISLEIYCVDGARNQKFLKKAEILRKITQQLEAIHSEGNVCGELTPSEVIIDEKGDLFIKLIGSKAILANNYLSEWRPAEERKSNSETKEGDVFNFGCFFYYIITGGQHPFGRSGQRISFIANNLYDLSCCEDEQLHKLIKRMIAHDSTKRPTCSEILHNYPVLWQRKNIEESLMKLAANPEYCDRYDKWKDHLLFSSSSSVKSVAKILDEIKGKQETPLNACNMFPGFLSSVLVPDGEIQNEISDESCPRTFQNLLIANDSFGVVGPFKKRHGRFGLQPVHVMEFAQTSIDFSESLFLMKRLACLSHPNLLKLFYVGENSEKNSSERFIILACEPFDETLETWMRKNNSLDYETAKNILNQITSGLLGCHSNNLVHGNITCSQIAIFNTSQNIIAKISKFPIHGKTEEPSMQHDIWNLGQIYWELFNQIKDVPPLCNHLILSLKRTGEECVSSCEALFYHPFFWSPGEIADFLLVAGDFYKDNPNIDRNSILESNQPNINSKQAKYQHLKTNRSAIEYFISTTVSAMEEIAITELAVHLTKQFPKLVIQTWLKLQKYKSMECGLDLASFYCPSYDFPTFEELRSDPEEIACQDMVVSNDEDEGYDSVSTKLLIKSQADVTKLDNFGRSPLYFAVATNSIENVDLLLMNSNPESVRKIVDAVDLDGMSPLHIAVAKNSIKMVELLLKKHKANPNVGKLDPKTPNIQQIPVLHLAVDMQLDSVIDLLLKAGADPDITNLHGQTSLHIAALNRSSSVDNRLKIVELLITNKEKRANVNAVDNNGITVLHAAILNESDEIVQRLLQCKPHIEVDKKEKEREITPLHLAAWKNLENITEMLINQGNARVDAKDKNGDTPLEYAASSDAIKVAYKLLKAGAFPKSKRWKGRSPLHVAAAHDALQVGALLIKKKADVNARDEFELTPLHYANFRGHDKFVELLSKDNQSCIANPPVSKPLTPTELQTVHQLTNGFKLNIPSQLKIELPPIVAQFNDFKLKITQDLIINDFQSN